MDRRRFLDLSVSAIPLTWTVLSSCKSSSNATAEISELNAIGPTEVARSPNGIVTNLRYDKVPIIRSQIKSKAAFPEDVKIIRDYAVKILNTQGAGKLTIRCGGHSYIGASVSPQGNVLDLSPFNHIEIYQSRSHIKVGGGCQFYQIANALAKLPEPSFIPSGDCPTVGVGGFISGGGLSRLSPILGMAVDNVVSLTAITFQNTNRGLQVGTIVNASPTENADLFWAMLGGGPQFAILADITFKYTVLKNYSAYVLGTGRVDEGTFKRTFRDWEKLSGESLNPKTSSNFQISNGANLFSLGVFSNESGDLQKLKSFAQRNGASFDVRPLTMENMYIMFAGCESLAGCKDKSWTSSKSYSVKKSRLIETRGSITSENLSKIFQKLTSNRASWASFQFNSWSGAIKTANPKVSFPWRNFAYECQISVDTFRQEDWREDYLQWVDDAAALLGDRKAAFFNHLNRDILLNKKLYFGSSWDKLVLIKKLYDPKNVFTPFRLGDSKT